MPGVIAAAGRAGPALVAGQKRIPTYFAWFMLKLAAGRYPAIPVSIKAGIASYLVLSIPHSFLNIN